MGRKSDFLLKDFLRELPGDGRMPTHWHYRSYEHFQKKYGKLGMVVWAAATNSHLLLVNGYRVLRVWMDVENTCWIDLSDQVASGLSVYSWGSVEPIPASNAKKSNPFTQRIKVSQRFQMQDIAKTVKRVYGLDSQRLHLHQF